MRNKIAKRIAVFLTLAAMIITALGIFTGCQSTDKSESHVAAESFKYTKLEYDSASNQTKVTWATTFSNETIYNITGFSVTFKLHDESSSARTETYVWDKKIKHGKDYTGAFNFVANGRITSAEYVSWSAEYSTFWNTYKAWFIVTIIVTALASIIGIIAMIVSDADIDDVGDFLEDNAWLLITFLVPFLTFTAYSAFRLNWVPILIVLGGIIIFAVILLIAGGIKYVADFGDCDCFDDCDCFNCSDCCSCFGSSRSRTNEYLDEIDEIENNSNNRDALMSFNVEQLKEYCRFKEIKGYSSLKKSDIVDLIADPKSDKPAAPKKTTTRKPYPKPRGKITFKDIAGLEEAKTAFKEKVVYATEHKDLYEKFGKKVGGGILLYGLPGTGKTMFAEAAANETDSLFIPIKCSDIKSKWYGESEANVKNIFEKARKAKKTIIFFDEFEAIGAKRTDNADNGNNDLVPQILAEMQGVGSSADETIITVIAATNKPWAIDSAFLRPGRFDEKIYIPLPDFEARKALFKLKLNNVPQDNLDFQYLATVTDGFNGADIGAFCDKLKMLAINKSIETSADCPITAVEVEQTRNAIKSSVSPEDIDRLLQFREQYR